MIREYENTPRPEVEQHYHIRELIERQEVRTQDRVYHQKKEKNAEERNSTIKDAKAKETLPFWCARCEKDFYGEAIKQVEIDWSCPTQYIAFYKTKCVCNTWCIRLITDRHRESYFYRSKRVARDRGVHHEDTVQSWETGFNLLYGRKNKA